MPQYFTIYDVMVAPPYLVYTSPTWNMSDHLKNF
jgi:hypothetical protein